MGFKCQSQVCRWCFEKELLIYVYIRVYAHIYEEHFLKTRFLNLTFDSHCCNGSLCSLEKSSSFVLRVTFMIIWYWLWRLNGVLVVVGFHKIALLCITSPSAGHQHFSVIQQCTARPPCTNLFFSTHPYNKLVPVVGRVRTRLSVYVNLGNETALSSDSLANQKPASAISEINADTWRWHAYEKAVHQIWQLFDALMGRF